ncbi:MAG: hypothetical protein ABIG93_00825 [archaeon]
MLNKALTGETYSRGASITTNMETVGSIIQRAEEVLGLERREHKFTIEHFPEELKLFAGGSYNAQELIFNLPREQREGTIFHEAVHFLMHQEGLLFGPDTQEASLYDRLIDETVAEFATSSVYGYNLRTRILKSLLEDDAYKRHRQIEQAFEREGDFEKLSYDVAQFYEFLDKSLDHAFAFATYSNLIRKLSMGNAMDLAKKGKKSADLVTILKDGVEKRWNSFGLYFQDIIMS